MGNNGEEKTQHTDPKVEVILYYSRKALKCAALTFPSIYVYTAQCRTQENVLTTSLKIIQGGLLNDVFTLSLRFARWPHKGQIFARFPAIFTASYYFLETVNLPSVVLSLSLIYNSTLY